MDQKLKESSINIKLIIMFYGIVLITANNTWINKKYINIIENPYILDPWSQ